MTVQNYETKFASYWGYNEKDNDFKVESFPFTLMIAARVYHITKEVGIQTHEWQDP